MHLVQLGIATLLAASESALAGASPPTAAFPSSFSLVIAPEVNGSSGVPSFMDVNSSSFAMQKIGGKKDANTFTANFCNASGMFAYVSGQTGCFYQQAICDPSGWRNSVAFLGLVGDMTFTLMIDGISPKAVPVPGPNSEVVWVDRIRTCSNKANRDVNVTLAADSSLLGWSRGSTVYGPPGKDRTCTVINIGRTITQFAPTSDIDGAQVEAFVRKRIASENLSCQPFQAA